MKYNYSCVKTKSKYTNVGIHIDDGNGLPLCGHNRFTKKFIKTDEFPTCLKCATNERLKDPELRDKIFERLNAAH